MASQSHSVFVSCSGADDEVRDVVERLRAQAGLEVWTFRMGGLPPGAEVAKACMEQVARSDVVIPILTRAALASSYVAQEVAAALAPPGRLVWTMVDSVLPTDYPTRDWPAPFRQLASYRYATVDFRKLESIEAAVAALCAELCIDHHPPIAGDADLPFVEKLYEELRGHQAGRHEYEHAVYSGLMRTAECFQGAFRRKEYERAAAWLDLLLATHRAEFPSAPPYYAMIARGLCAAALGEFDRALQLLDECMRSCARVRMPNRPDETLHSALGSIQYQLGMFDLAAKSFRRALDIQAVDPADHWYLLLSRMQAGESIDLDEELERIDRIPVRPRDRAAADLARARAYRLAGRLGEASQLVLPLAGCAPSDPEVCLECAELLDALGRPSEADSVIAKCPTGDHPLLEGRRLMARLARTRKGAWRRDADAFLERHVHNRHGAWFVLDLFRQAGMESDARGVARLILDSDRFGLPTSRLDFLICGNANRMLGREERARYDFERAGKLAFSSF